MELKALLKNLDVQKILGETNKIIHQIYFDSREIGQKRLPEGSTDLFVAIKGVQFDGHDFIEKAIKNGAKVILTSRIPEHPSTNITWIQVKHTTKALGILAAEFYGHPSRSLQLVGITGTNGKTTIVTLLHQLLSDLGYKTGLLSTIENKTGTQLIEATHTTPDAITINRLLAEMVEEGCDYAFMEVSSHAIDQHRVEGLHFVGGVYTNLSHEHLDYHKTFKEYISVKKRFFDELPKSAFALINVDDKNGNVMVQNTKASIARYSFLNLADFKGKIIENSLTGLHLEFDNTEFFGRLIGDFNAYNLLAIYGTAMLLGFDKTEIITVLSNLKSAEGRFDYVVDKKTDRIGIIDYAHTPDALEKVLQTIAHLQKAGGKIITVVGCGGDRDRTKRPVMAQIAAKYSDKFILTSDNPRTEDPFFIIKEMEAGLSAADRVKYLNILDRKDAIKTACFLAQKGDIILVAGKGHEKYQKVEGKTYPFDDKAVLMEFLTIN